MFFQGKDAVLCVEQDQIIHPRLCESGNSRELVRCGLVGWIEIEADFIAHILKLKIVPNGRTKVILDPGSLCHG
jgi:hypothetical protein